MSPMQPGDLDEALHTAFPPAQPVDMSNYVTRMELSSDVRRLELKIENSELKQRNWVLGGCVAMLLAFGGGWMSLYAKVDSLTEASTRTISVLEKRTAWMERQEQVNQRQDRALEKVNKDYAGDAYSHPPD